MPEIEFVRVRDTNGEFTTSRASAEADGLEVLDKPAVDQIGRPLPAKPKVGNPSTSPRPSPKAKPDGREAAPEEEN